MASSLWTEDRFSCPICLDILKDPAALPCGHSYCMGCIKSHWDQDDRTGVYSCPQCRETFTPRPALCRNIILAEVVEKLKETGLSGPPAPESTAGPGDVLCDVCTGSQVRAVKSCLVCLASYCQTHLQPHCEAAPLKRHQLVEATGQLQEKICSSHDKPLEVYCHTDQRCICMLCTMDEHRGHDTVSAAAGRTEKQRQLQEIQTQTQRKIQEREKKLQELRQAGESFKGAGDSPSITVDSNFSFEAVRRAVSGLKERLEDIWNGESKSLSLSLSASSVKDISIVQAAEPRTRAEFLQCESELTLDPNTAHRHLRLSEGNRRVTWNEKTQPYPNHPGRFDCYYQVLCREGLSDRRCYWEVEYTGKVDIGVTYKGIGRKGEGDGCILGYNDKSWRLNCSESGYAVWHCKNETPVTARHSNRIGVYVDHEAGTLSFYSVSDQMILLHRFQTSFTEPLYPGFWVRWSGCGVKLLSSV
uniref:Tripartite motif-containing protein 16-like n=1 Tax=Lepisosteus oculatus TaxID=7918 RepID=W5NKK9_LEPOC